MIPPTRLLDSEFLTSPLLFFFFLSANSSTLFPAAPLTASGRSRNPAGPTPSSQGGVEELQQLGSVFIPLQSEAKRQNWVSPAIQKLSWAHSAAHLFVFFWFLHFHLDLFPWNHAVLALLPVLQILRQKKWVEIWDIKTCNCPQATTGTATLDIWTGPELSSPPLAFLFFLRLCRFSFFPFCKMGVFWWQISYYLVNVDSWHHEIKSTITFLWCFSFFLFFDCFLDLLWESEQNTTFTMQKLN